MQGTRTGFAWYAAALLVVARGPSLEGQQPAAPGRVAVFLDCQTFCDFDFVRREITFVDWVRDRNDADVHLLLTSQETGGGGREYTLAFIGLRRFASTADTLRVITRNTDVDDDIRNAQTKVIKLGLVRFVAGSPAAEHMRVVYEAPADSSSKKVEHDPWNYWVFRLNFGGFGNGERTSSFLSVNGSFSANRVTEDWKIQLSGNGRRQRNAYELIDTTGLPTTVESIQRNYGADGLIVRSIGAQWSAGFRANGRSNSRINQRLTLSGGPAIEFDFFPYSQSTRQQVTLQYSVTPVHYSYEDSTVFDRTSETRIRHQLQLAAGVTQPWGSVHASVNSSVFIDNWAQHSVDVFGGLDVRIFRGLSVNLFGEFTRLKDQIYLRKAEVDNNSILLGQFQLGTDYQYFLDFGFSYQFGSKFNNVVNPRFNGGN
jgi:hypothetical protein